jgi:GAF domain
VKVATSRVKILADARLEAARHRLQESVNPVDTVEAIREIVTGLVGCEEIALFTVDPGKSTLFWSFGIDPTRHKTLDTLEEPALQRVLRGEIYIVPAVGEQRANAANPPLRVFVPIRVSGRTVAVLVMLKLLPQKIGFDESDMQLVELLSNEAGRALFGGGMDSQPQAGRRNG